MGIVVVLIKFRFCGFNVINCVLMLIILVKLFNVKVVIILFFIFKLVIDLLIVMILLVYLLLKGILLVFLIFIFFK